MSRKYNLFLFVVLGFALSWRVVAPLPAEAAEDVYGYLDDDGSVHEPALEALRHFGYLEETECAERHICPDQDILRWELAVWLARAVEGYSEKGLVFRLRFEDVDSTQWWSHYTERLAALEITDGCGNGWTFCPYNTVTRSQAASFLVRAFDIPPSSSAGFLDLADNAHTKNIDALASSHITTGCSQEPMLFCPNDHVTRGQMATFLARALGLVALPDGARYPSIHNKQYNIPTFFCAPDGQYTDERMVGLVANLSSYVNDFYMRESSGRADVRLVFGGRVEANLDWDSDFETEFPYIQISKPAPTWPVRRPPDWKPQSYPNLPYAPCDRAGMYAANEGTSNYDTHVLLLVGLPPGDAIAGQSFVGSGPSKVALPHPSLGFLSEQQNWMHKVVAHELGHSLFGWEQPAVGTPSRLGCVAADRDLMGIGDCYKQGDLPLGDYYINCSDRRQHNWACGGAHRQTYVPSIPISSGVWRHWWYENDMHVVRGVWSASSGVNYSYLGSCFNDFCWPTDVSFDLYWQFDCFRTTQNSDWGLRFQITSNRDTLPLYLSSEKKQVGKISAVFSDSSTHTFQLVTQRDGFGFYIGEGNELPIGAKNIAELMVGKSGQDMSWEFYTEEGEPIDVELDTTGADVALRSVLNFCVTANHG